MKSFFAAFCCLLSAVFSLSAHAAVPAASSYLTFGPGLSAVQKVTNDDGDHYRVEVTLTNTTSSAISWSARLDDEVKLTNLWGATHQLAGGYETLRGLSTLAAGASYGWGYEGDRVQPTATTSTPSFRTNVTTIVYPDTLVGQASTAERIVVYNTGKVALTLTGIVVSGPQAAEFTTTSCAATIQPGYRCSFKVTGEPRAAGLRTAAVTISARDVASRTVPLQLNAVTSTPPAGTVPVPGAGYRAAGGLIHDAGGNVVQVRGVNMYGFNADVLIPQYLWQVGWKSQLQQVKNLGFNAIRVPFVPDTLYYPTAGYFDASKNPEFVGKTPLQILDIWLAEANRLGLHFVLDFHSVSRFGQNNTWHTTNGKITWNGQPYTEDHWVRDLVFVANRYEHLSHFMGIDLYNEPTGEVRWGNGDTVSYRPENDWKRAAERASAAIIAANPNVLVFVEGISGNYDGVEDNVTPINYAENLRPQAYLPLNIPSSKLVFAPHSYGPDVYEKSTFSHPSFPANLAADWEKLFGRFSSQHPIVMGEFGGRYGDGLGGTRDIAWQNAFVDWLISKNLRGGFYWCYTPNSWDTGGILDDNLVVREDKMALLRRLWGN